jgi:hypothetical protein
MTDINPTKVTPGQGITDLQKKGLELVSSGQGRDVVLAIDRTESVGYNSEGIIRLRQIVEDSLLPGDTVYLVPFATTVNPYKISSEPIEFKSKQDIDKILGFIQKWPDFGLKETDIQLAELKIYQNLAQLNQDRLNANQPIKFQSVVWITDAPLFTKAPAISKEWIETPKDSPMRLENSLETRERQEWFKVLPLKQRSREIITNNNQRYKLSVVDIPPTVQEFCTPTPQQGETCLVNPYLFKQLALRGGIVFIVIIAVILAAIKFYTLNKKWSLTIKFLDDDDMEESKIFINNNEKIAIGNDGNESKCIECPGNDVRGYIERKGEKLFLKPTEESPIYYHGREVTQKTELTGNSININCPDNRNKDFEISISIKK